MDFSQNQIFRYVCLGAEGGGGGKVRFRLSRHLPEQITIDQKL